MKFVCHRHPDRDGILISGYSNCHECSREIEREIIIRWAHHVKPEFTRPHVIKILEEMFGTKDFGFSTFSNLYQVFKREMNKPRKNSFGFAIPQSEYIQDAFLKFIGEK